MKILLKFKAGCSIKSIIPTVIVFLSIFILPDHAGCQNNPVTIGVLTNHGYNKCLVQWGPTAEYLTTKIPESAFKIVPLDSDELYPAVKGGDVDFIICRHLQLSIIALRVGPVPCMGV